MRSWSLNLREQVRDLRDDKKLCLRGRVREKGSVENCCWPRVLPNSTRETISLEVSSHESH